MKYLEMVKVIEEVIRKSETPYINELAKQILDTVLENGIQSDYELSWEEEEDV